MPSKDLSRDVKTLVLRLCEDVASPRALAVSLMVRHGEWDSLSILKCDPGHYVCSDDYYRDVAVTDFLRKLEELPTTVDRRKVANDTFWECERTCYQANERLSRYLDWGLAPTGDVVGRVILLARKKIADLLRSPPTLVEGRFGPGATYGDRGRLTTVPDKMSSRPTFTADAYPWLFQWGGTAWASACASAGKSIESVPGNRFTTVPKDCTKDRGIAIEPSINVFFQLGLGRVMKRRLSAAGLNLQYAQDIHKRVACEASISGDFATIDLSNASDTVCRNLVKLLLPSDWHELLDSLRSPKTHVDGKWVVLEKFSSMGNGFTFELETCLFAGICSAVLDLLGTTPLLGENLFVFGDDIIVPTNCAREVIAVLRFLGFKENSRKTFLVGPFRESCGGDYFDGKDVRPYYLKNIPTQPSEWIALANGLYRLGRPDPSGQFTHQFVHRSRLAALDWLPSHIRNCRGPQDLGDLVVHDVERTWKTRQRHSIRYFKVWRPAKYRRVAWEHFRPDVILASAVYGIKSGTQDAPIGYRGLRPGGVIPRDAVLGFKLGWVPRS
uniref:RNA-directed RNA polymerase n=1 Tax=Leviviridae sp. TaxID=2027243 RepID=A0A514DA91_9VIRU|nr:MAG: RNA-dependent RNA polymerase [Leviviridae sp.]